MKETEVLSAILDWKMTNDEAEIFKLAAIYEDQFLKTFKNADGSTRRRNTLPRTGDPRKSNLFRFCWKLRRETRGLLEFNQYPHYILANFHIIQHHKGYIAPNSVCGDKAWIRWKTWKRWYDKKIDAFSIAAAVSNIDPKIIRDIDRTKKFLFERCDGSPTEEKIAGFITNNFMKMWILTGKVCSYYIVLSPFLKKNCNVKDFCNSCSIDSSLIEGMITQPVKDYFANEYIHEFG